MNERSERFSYKIVLNNGVTIRTENKKYYESLIDKIGMERISYVAKDERIIIHTLGSPVFEIEVEE